jgi:hypothetical protein
VDATGVVERTLTIQFHLGGDDNSTNQSVIEESEEINLSYKTDEDEQNRVVVQMVSSVDSSNYRYGDEYE